MTSAPCSSKSAANASRNATLNLFRAPFARPPLLARPFSNRLVILSVSFDCYATLTRLPLAVIQVCQFHLLHLLLPVIQNGGGAAYCPKLSYGMTTGGSAWPTGVSGGSASPTGSPA